MFLEDEGEIEAAIESYHRAFAIEPNKEGLREQLTDLHNRRGLTLQASHDNAAAAIHFRESLALQPDDALAQLGLGLTLLDLGQFRESLEQLQRGTNRSAASGFKSTSAAPLADYRPLAILAAAQVGSGRAEGAQDLDEMTKKAWRNQAACVVA